MLSATALCMIQKITRIDFSRLTPRSWLKKAVTVVLLSVPLLAIANEPPTSNDDHHYALIVDHLLDGSFNDKREAVALMANWPTENAIMALQALLDGDVVAHSTERVLAMPTSSGMQRITPHGLVLIPTDDLSNDFGRVRTNNRIRGDARQRLAGLQLSSEQPSVRAIALADMMRQLTPHNVAFIATARPLETDDTLATQMDIALNIGLLNNPASQPAELIEAIEWLSGHLEPAAFNALTQLQQRHDDVEVLAATDIALKRIESKRSFYKNVETLFFGLSLGSVLVLAAIGLAITFGVMGVINMAHGELIMLGAYTTFVIQQLMPNHIGLSVVVAIPAAFVVAGLVGIVMERLVIRHLYGRPLETLLATFGISLILQQAVRTIFSPLNQSISTPEWMSGMLHINSVLALSWNRIYIIVFCLAVFFLLLLVMKRSALGLHVRAVSQNRMMARAMGIRSERVDILTFGLGAGIAGIAGVALSLITNVGPNLGQAYIIDSFIVVVFGGVGNLYGTLVAGMSLGILNKFMEPWAGAVLAKILLLVFIILFIQKRPQGLFPQRGRAVEH